MSILINMEMPKSCLNCFLSRSGCRAVLKRMRAMEAGTWIPANYRHDDCPLVPVPPHGRCIDADALADVFRGFIAMYDSCPFSQLAPTDKARRDELQAALAEVINAPTIIPASGGNEGEEHTMDEFMYGQEGNPNDGSM